MRGGQTGGHCGARTATAVLHDAVLHDRGSGTSCAPVLYQGHGDIRMVRSAAPGDPIVALV